MKRISNSERKRLVKKKKQKRRRKLVITANISEALARPIKKTNLIFSCLLAGIAFFIVFSPIPPASPSSTMYGMENGREVALASTFDDDKKEALSEAEILAAEAELKRAEELKRDILLITKDTPMEAMTDDIAKKDRATAAYLVGIALKESEFGFHSPKTAKNADCYNYWGYRGRENPTKSGYSCFDSPAHAVKVVGGRIESLIKQGVKSPAGMVVWKCGFSCAGFDKASVRKWISDVSINYYKLNPVGGLAKKN